VGGAGDGTLHADDGSGTRDAGNSGILAMGEGDDALTTNDNSGALRANDDNDVPSGGSGDDATTPIIGMIGADSSLGASDVLTVIGGGSIAIDDDYSVTISGGGNLNADAFARGRCQQQPRRGQCLGCDRRRCHWRNLQRRLGRNRRR
jgi:hypothetical protein